ncbi:MAG: Gfo/Idh/MocA family oxidoreductase [Cyanobacteria bacterium P01_E01_bin.42]
MTIRVGIIGLGRIGHGFGVSPRGDPLSHSEAYRNIPDVQIVFGVDSDLSACDRFQARFPKARTHSSLSEIPENTELDVVSVCSPTPLHGQGVRAALAWQPRVILCEKPLAPTVAEARQIVTACAERDCILMANYSRRWTPMLQTLKTAIAPDGALGLPKGACLRYNGGLQHNGTHWIDLLVALFDRPHRAYCLESPPPDKVDPAESIALVWEHGFTAYLIAVRETGCSLGEGEIWGTQGLVRYGQSGRTVTLQHFHPSAHQGFQELAPPEILCEAGMSGHILNAVSEAVGLAKQVGQPTCSGEDGVLALEIVEMARRSRIAYNLLTLPNNL